MTLVRDLYDWVLNWADSPYSIYALFALSFAESSFFPIPPDVLLMALTLGEPGQGLWFATITTVGSVAGGALGYLIGYAGGRPLLRRWVSEDKVRLVHDYFQRYEVWAIGIAGFTPIPYKLFTISAGVFFINFPLFILVSLASRGARFFLVAGTIQMFGPAMKRMIEEYFDLFTILFFVLLVGGFYLVKVHAQRRLIRESGSGGSKGSER